MDLKFPEIAMPLRVRLAGNLNTPNIGSIIFILGLDEVKEVGSATAFKFIKKILICIYRTIF